jgi:hypothetical protein
MHFVRPGGIVTLIKRLVLRASILLIPFAGVVPAQSASASLPALCIGTATITCSFEFTGTMQLFTVPNGVKSLTIEARGAQGAGNDLGSGEGGLERGTIAVVPGKVLDINVGGVNGFNGGGAGSGGGSNGGGASDVRPAGGALLDRIITAGGGGGAGYAFLPPAPAGGAGGGGNGGDATGDCSAGTCARGATDMIGGAGSSSCGAAATGTSGEGGAGCGGGGGGGGWYGGGGGSFGNSVVSDAGGGGSGHVASTVTNKFEQAGVQDGDGLVELTFTPNPALVPTGHLTCNNATGSATLVPPLTNTPSLKAIKVKIAATGSCFSEGVIGGKGVITDATLTATVYLAPGATCTVPTRSTDKVSKLKIKWQGRNPKNALYTIATTNAVSQYFVLTNAWLVQGLQLTDPKKPFVGDIMTASLPMSESDSTQELLCGSTGLALLHIVNGQLGG